MALAAVTAAALTDHSARAYGLYVNGLDVIKEPGSGAGLYGVPIETIEVHEAGPGGVSSMRFTVDDPGAELVFAAGDEVRYEDLVAGTPEFRGWLTTPATVPAFGTGRQITVEAIGVEAVLDWAISPALTIDLSVIAITTEQLIQALCARAFWPPGVALRAFVDPTGGSRGSQALPLSTFENSFPLPLASVTIPAGTLRNAIQYVCDLSAASQIGHAAGWRAFVTVDFYLGLRGWLSGGVTEVPSDYATLTVTRPEDGSSTVDGDGVVRGVYVVGGTAAGTGVVMDGTGLPGRIVTLTDTSVLTLADKYSRAARIFAGAQAVVAGEISQDDFAAVTGVHPGGRLTLTSPNTGATGDYTIMAIDKTYNASGRENWRVRYGALPPTAALLLRRLTRSTLS